jgi:hypothetical protein
LELHSSVSETFSLLAKESPGAKLLALGQTVFWDEPMKALLPLLARKTGHDLKLLAGVHDTDYFAKLPGELPGHAPFVALAKNDGSTKGFWSAAGEFSSLFGSETPVTREALSAAGVSLDRIIKRKVMQIDEATEAYGWRGLASRDSAHRVAAEIPLASVFPAIESVWHWALEETLRCVANEEDRVASFRVSETLRTMVCDTMETCHGQTLGGFYECLLPKFHEVLTGEPCQSEITRTTRLLEFSLASAHLPRFQFVELFLSPETSASAKEAYNEAVHDSEIYPLERFGTGAIPFDLVIPGKGRGTIRLTNHFLVVSTPEPQFTPLDKPIETLYELASVVERAFGPCTLIGKAVTLISMLASEFVFVLSDGGSPYIVITKKLNKLLRDRGLSFYSNPILRLSLNVWDALDETCVWFRLPEPFQGPFGAENVCGPTIARTWRDVVKAQQETLRSLADARSPHSLIDLLRHLKGGKWRALHEEYEKLGEQLFPLHLEIANIQKEISDLHERLRNIKKEWQSTEVERGVCFRAGTEDALRLRDRLGEKIQELRNERRDLAFKLNELRELQSNIAHESSVNELRMRRKEIELEAEMARYHIARDAILTAYGFPKTNNRPCSWWIPVASPDSTWFRSIAQRVQLRLESLTDTY